MSINKENSPLEESLASRSLEILLPYQKRFQQVFLESLDFLGDDSEMRRACAYAMSSGGKRLRPAIVWMVAEALGSKENVDRAALAVEFFHISSLVTDDLPCMDNDDVRRGIPTTHKVFSEATALLSSYALTAAAFEGIASLKIALDRPYDILQTLITRASRAIGGPGLIGGQFLDLNPPHVTKEIIEEIFDKKTGVLFDLAFLFGWLLGGGSFEKLDLISSLAKSFGRAFQIVDDIADMKQDERAGKKINFALCFGEEAAKEEARKYIDSFCALAQELGLAKSPLLSLATLMRP